MSSSSYSGDTAPNPLGLDPPTPFFAPSQVTQSNSPFSPSSRSSTPDSQLSAHTLARRREEDELLFAAAETAGVDLNDGVLDDEEVPTQASIVEKVFTDADKAAKDEDDAQKKSGRQEGSLQWTGPELRALLVAMVSHDVFDPTLTADKRSQNWLDTVAELNKWNKLHPRKNGRFPIRTVEACDTKWRRSLYKAIKKGQSASEIASGPKEEEKEIMKACEQLKEQWEQSVRDEATKREAKKKAKSPEKAMALDARDKATNKSEDDGAGDGEDVVKRERDTSAGDDPLTAKSDGRKTPKRLRARRSDGASSELTTAVESMGAQQLLAAADTLKQQQQHHEETLRQAERARELERKKHNDLLLRADRKLDLEEAQGKQEGKRDERVAAVESKIDNLMAFLKEKLA
ncbi:hypothetical protein CF326_g2437 [Tilletia indica]|nr:hypothetical protein CF326_g2437 [Tilletia indica]